MQEENFQKALAVLSQAGVEGTPAPGGATECALNGQPFEFALRVLQLRIDIFKIVVLISLFLIG